jgi:prolyl oligopeptidase
LVTVAADAGASRYVLSRETVASADGTAVNVYLIHDASLLRDGNNPVLLYGYGGFSVSLLPSFSRSALYWLERGGVYAVANIRGGGEFGEQWHRAGMLANKHHVFEDFEAVIQWLTDSKVSRPGRLAIQGGSNGGLLMGAMLTRAPDKFGAVIAGVGLYDMVRYPQFPPAALWVSEYGDPERAEVFNYLHMYSPYHRVVDGTVYPFTLIETADHDTRVHWAHSTKFAARVQQAAADPTRIYFYMERQLGHGRGTSLNDQVRRQVRTQAFLTRALGM